MKQLDSDSTWIYFNIWIITFSIETQIWWFKMIQKEDLKGYNSYVDHFSNTNIDKLYVAINMPTSCRSELNIHIKSNLKIRRGFKIRNNQLPLSLYSSTTCISLINTCNVKGKWERLSRDRLLGQLFILFSVGFYFHFI